MVSTKVAQAPRTRSGTAQDRSGCVAWARGAKTGPLVPSTCASPPMAGPPVDTGTPGLGRHSAALEVTSRPASKARSLSAGMAGRLWVAVDRHPHTPGLSWEAAAPPTQAQGQTLPICAMGI